MWMPQSCHFDYTNFFDTACTSRDCQDTLGENDSVFSKLCRKFSVTWRGGEVEALIWDRYRNKSTTIHQKGLKVGRSALLTKFFLQIFNRKEHTHILTKKFAKNPVISAICEIRPF